MLIYLTLTHQPKLSDSQYVLREISGGFSKKYLVYESVALDEKYRDKAELPDTRTKRRIGKEKSEQFSARIFSFTPYEAVLQCSVFPDF